MTVVWITGLPSSGKSTLAKQVRQRLRAAGTSAVLLDGDEVRQALGMHDYSADGRSAFYRALAGLAGLVAWQGMIAIVAATSPAREHRHVARQLAPALVEVYVDTPLAECTRRDAKGLYAEARDAGLPNVPGSGTEYEPPAHPDVVAHGGHDEVAIAAIVERLRGTLRA